MSTDEPSTEMPATAALPMPDDGVEMKKPELVDRVVARSGLKKKDVKPAVEAMLAVMGQALSDGEELNLQPFGKLRVARRKDLANGQVLTIKLRRSGPSIQETAAPLAGREGLAEAGEDG